MTRIVATALAFLCAAPWAAANQDGPALMAASLQRYALPNHVYEEQALVISDRQGNRTVRTIRSYTLQDAGGTKNLRVIETPPEARGASLYIERGRPATTGPAFGSNFTIADLAGEQPSDFRYERDTDRVLGRVQHYVLRAIPVDEAVTRRTGYRGRLFYLRKDNLFVSRIDYQDGNGHTTRRQTFRDPAPDDYGIWRPRMILMESLVSGERSLVKVERRIHSADYVPAALFEGLRTNR